MNFDTVASGVDTDNQLDVISNMGSKGFYIFQIWNKKGDINTYLYDLDNNIFYDKKDIELEIEDEKGTLDEWVTSTKALVQPKKYTYPYQYPKKSKSKKETKDSVDETFLRAYNYANGDWSDYNLERGWDY